MQPRDHVRRPPRIRLNRASRLAMHAKHSTAADGGDSEARGVSVTPGLADPSDSQLLGECCPQREMTRSQRVLIAMRGVSSQIGLQAGIEAAVLDAANVCDRV